MKEDHIFAGKKQKILPFAFNQEVTDVFDDMLVRSVPLYKQSIQRQAQLAAHFYQPGTRIYDLGCSHGNIGVIICNLLQKEAFSMIGVDSSRPMIQKYMKRLEKKNEAKRVKLVCGFIEDIEITDASVVIINLTLQFIRPALRQHLIEKIYQGLKSGGILLLTEKIIHADKRIDALQTMFYTSFKLENGYSDLEISQKREALDKALIPDTLDIHKKRILNAGFTKVELWLRWFNFSSLIAIKD